MFVHCLCDLDLYKPQFVTQALNLNKAPDIEGLTAEHIRYAGTHLLDCLTAIINTILANRDIPHYLKRGLLFSVYKKKPPITNPQNHRGITITMVICKIIEIVIKTSVTDTLNQTQHYLQRGFTEGVSPIYAAFLVHELQNEAFDLKLPLYVGYLDAKAAFDTVWIGSLMRKLHFDGITSDDWLLISSLHQDATTRVKWCDILTDTFPVNQGVRQGGILSTQEYKRFINPLLQLLESFKIGGYIHF